MLRNDQDLIVEEDPEDEDEVIASVKSKNTYIRWDFLAHVLNRNIMERTQLGDSPLIYFKTDVIVNAENEFVFDPPVSKNVSVGSDLAIVRSPDSDPPLVVK